MTSATASKTVLDYTQLLCNALEHSYMNNRIRLHNRALAGGYDVEYHDNELKKIANGDADVAQFTIDESRKYLKIIYTDRSGGRSIHAFVNKETGDVFKPASWQSPAKKVRYNLMNENEREFLIDNENADWAGGYLYMTNAAGFNHKRAF